MSVANVYTKLQNSIAECESGALDSEARKNYYKGMSNGFQLALRVLADEKVFPESKPDTMEEIPYDSTILPFKISEGD